MLEKSFHLKNCQVIANNIAYHLNLKGKTRQEACKELGFAYSTFTEWLTGKSYPRIDKIEKMADYFNISKADLIEDKSNVINSAAEGENKSNPAKSKNILLCYLFGAKVNKNRQDGLMEKINISAAMGQIIRQHREQKGMTQKELAQLLGVSKSTVGKWETGAVRNLKVEVMHHVSKVLDIEPMALSGIAGADNHHQKIIASMFDFSKEEFEQVCDFIAYIKAKRK